MPHRPTRFVACNAKLLVLTLLGTLAGFTGLAGAQVPDIRPQEQVVGRLGERFEDENREGTVGEALSLDAGVSASNSYFFRGALQLDDDGMVFQPYAEIGVDVANAEDYDVNAYVGTWNSFHTSTPTPPTSSAGPDAWYESDLYGGLEFTTGDFTFGAVYTFYTSPNNSFNTIQEVGLIAGWLPDFSIGDSENLDFTLGIGGGVFFETRDNTGTEDAYAEIGIMPGIEFDVSIGGDEATPVSLTFPVVVGLSLDDYYFDLTGDEELIGYVSVAAKLTAPLPIPLEYGRWHVTGGVQAYFLQAESLEFVNEGDSTALVGTIGVGVEM